MREVVARDHEEHGDIRRRLEDPVHLSEAAKALLLSRRLRVARRNTAGCTPDCRIVSYCRIVACRTRQRVALPLGRTGLNATEAQGDKVAAELYLRGPKATPAARTRNAYLARCALLLRVACCTMVVHKLRVCAGRAGVGARAGGYKRSYPTGPGGAKSMAANRL